MALVDPTGESVKVNQDGLVKVDGIGVFRLVVREDVTYIQFCDHDRMRIQCRNSKFVEIPLEILIAKIEPVVEENEKSPIRQGKTDGRTI